MSFLLDALRKSDARRRLQGPPGLHSAETPLPQRSRSNRRLIFALVPVAGVVVLAGLLAGVFMLKPQWLPDRLTAMIAPTEAPLGEADPSPPGQTLSGQPGHSLSDAEEHRRQLGEAGQAESPDAADDDQTAETEAAQTAHTDSEPEVVVDRRQPLGGRAARTVTRQAPQRETPPVPADQALAELERRVAESADSAASSRRRSTESEAPSRPARSERTGETAETDAERSSSQPLHTDVAEYVRVWELPLSVRRSLPDLELTIHVFSPRENERFVLVNGERYIAGDVLGQGAQLVDIRREGAIVDFRSHRFLLEPR